MPAYPGRGQLCHRCLEEHDPNRCQAHSKGREGKQCGKPAMNGQTVCNVHGGRNPTARSAAEVRDADAKVKKMIGRLPYTPIGNPLAALQDLAGRAYAWMEWCSEQVAELRSLRYGTDGGEQIRGEVIVFERALDQCRRVLADTARLNIDARLAAITEQQTTTMVGMLWRVIQQVMSDPDMALTEEQRRTFALLLRRHGAPLLDDPVRAIEAPAGGDTDDDQPDA